MRACAVEDVMLGCCGCCCEKTPVHRINRLESPRGQELK